MATQAQLKSMGAFFRRIAASTPYWRTRLEDEQEPAPMVGVGRQIVYQVTFVTILTMLVLLPAAYLSMLVFVTPGGLPQVIGTQLADICLATGNCDIRYLLAGYAFAVDFVIVASAFLWITIGRASRLGETTSDLEQDLAFLDARIVGLRNELVMAGIITLPAEERKDAG